MTDTAIIRRVLIELRDDSSTQDAPDSRRDAEAALVALDRKSAAVKNLGGAIRYLLVRVQFDPDLGYYLGPHIEPLERLVGAYGLAVGEPADELRSWAAQDGRPPHDRRPPEVEVLRRRVERLQQRVERLEMRLAAHGEEVADA